MKNILIYGHRGARGLAPENTIPGFKAGIAAGVDYVDMDVNITKDNVVVVTHDAALNPNITRDANGNWINVENPPYIKDLTFAELQQYDVGRLKPGTNYAKYFPEQQPVDNTHIPSLEQVIKYVKQASENKVKFQIEMKSNIAAAVVKIINQENIADRTELQSFDWQALQEVQQINPRIATAYLTTQENHIDAAPNKIAALGGKIWGPESKELTAELVTKAHQLGLKVVPWSMPGALDNPKEIKRMLKIGVDGIITDRPDIVRNLLVTQGN